MTSRTKSTKTATQALRDYYDSTDQSAALGGATYESTNDGADEVLVSTSIRLPKSLMDQVRARAEAAGVPATTLMRQWITANVHDTTASEQFVSVADLEQLIAARAHAVTS